VYFKSSHQLGTEQSRVAPPQRVPTAAIRELLVRGIARLLPDVTYVTRPVVVLTACEKGLDTA
jgi:hypothetical protein